MKLNEDISRIKEIINEQEEACPKTLTGKKLKSKKASSIRSRRE